MKQIILVGLTFAVAGGQEAVEKERKNLQGAWVAIAFEESGKKASARLLQSMLWEFKGDEFIRRAEGQIEMKGSYRIDPGKKPKEIDLFDPERRKINCLGIYEIQADTLKIRFHQDKEARPKAFTTEPASQDHFLLVLKRSKK